MSTPDDLRRAALALPEAYEDLHRRRPAFRVGGRIFAMLGVVGEASLFPGLAATDLAVVKLEREDQLNMIAAYPAALEATESYGHHGWTYVRLPTLGASELALMVDLAWTHVAPKRLTKARRAG